MADFAHGFAYETNVTAPLTIEGVEVIDFKCVGGMFSGVLPVPGHSELEKIPAPSVHEFVEQYVELTGALAARQAATKEHLQHLRQGREHWNQWRRDNPMIHPMLACVVASEDFPDVPSLDHYDFSYANFCEAQLQSLSMQHANFHQAILAGANLSDANVENANFCRTDLYKTNLTGAHLKCANLQGVQLAMTDLSKADLTGCKIYGMSTWDVIMTEDTIQGNLKVLYNPIVGVLESEEYNMSGLNVAAFMHFTRRNANIKQVIDTANQKWVLLLGRFKSRRAVLDKIKDELTENDLIPIIFDFERSDYRDLIETVILLAGMSFFVIVDLTDPQSAPLELQAIAVNYGVPIFPVIQTPGRPFSMFHALRKFPWVHRPLEYSDPDKLKDLIPKLITQAGKEMNRLTELKREVESPL